MFKPIATVAAMLLALTGTACAGEMDMKMEPPGGDYAKVSSLVALPDFIPGLGTLYVQPSTLPAGPFLAYDKDGKLVSSIYMVPLESMQNEKRFDDLSVGADSVREVDMYYNAGHPGVPDPHYHIVLWHVAPDTAMLE
ncbi:MAG: hypothetical protein R3316_10465 [Rhodovibrionaceae bacterium]|nr:hypothetical protein [Rhodovibrionaceae bacterium]